MRSGKKTTILILSAVLLAITSFFTLNKTTIAHADAASTVNDLQQQIAAHDSTIAQLEQEISQYQTAINQASTQANTLKNTITTLDTNSKKLGTELTVTDQKVSATNLQIEQLQVEIKNKEAEIQSDKAALADSIREVDESDGDSFISDLLTNDDMSVVWNNIAATEQFESNVKDSVASLLGLKQDLQANESDTQTQKKQLTSLQSQLANQKAAVAENESQESELLKETKNKESKYQTLLVAAKAELSSFSAFAKNAGGSGLLTDQTSCDAWGCYYNQRDAAWGNDALNGTSYRLASDGCLITSMAMVMTHYGYPNVTPETINSNPENFAPYYPAYLLNTIYVDNVTATRKTTAIDATLSTGNPVIVGLNAYGGTHFVVLISGEDGNYVMRDPYVANGKDINFTDHYSLSDIYEIDKVAVNS